MMEHLADRLRHASRIDLRSLSIYRIIFGSMLLFVFLPQFSWIGDLPPTLFKPPLFSIANLFSGFPPKVFFQVIDGLILLSLIGLTMGFFTRMCTFILLVALILGFSFQYSLGKIDHPILFISVLFLMLFNNWGAWYSADRWLGRTTNEKEHTDLSLLAVIAAFGFFTAGYSKALNWIDFDLTTSGVLSWVETFYYTQGLDKLLIPWAIDFREPIFWELLDATAVIFELGFLFAIFHRNTLYLWLGMWCLFHFINSFLLFLPFEINWLVVTAFISWNEFRRGGLLRRAYPVLIVSLAGLGIVLIKILAWSAPPIDITTVRTVIQGVIWLLLSMLFLYILKVGPGRIAPVSSTGGDRSEARLVKSA
jgi:hypothetical protein